MMTIMEKEEIMTSMTSMLDRNQIHVDCYDPNDKYYSSFSTLTPPPSIFVTKRCLFLTNPAIVFRHSQFLQ